MATKQLRIWGSTAGYIAWTAGAFFVTTAIIGIWVALLAPESFLNWLDTPLGNFSLAAVVYTLAAQITLSLYRFQGIKKGAEIARRLGLAKKPTVRMLGWAFVLWACYFTVSIVVNLILYTINIPWLDLNQAQEIGFTGMTQPIEYIVAFLALVVIAPVFEELMFRGFLFERLRRMHKWLIASVLTSIVFGAIHMQVNVAIDVFVLSMFMCYARERFDSVYPPIFMHMLKNGFAYTLLFIAPLWGLNLV